MSTLRLIAALLMCLQIQAGLFAQDDPFNSGADPFSKGRRQPAANRAPTQTPSNTKTRTTPSKQLSPTETEQQLHASLADETSQVFINAPLEEALQAISELHNLPIVVDKRALEEIGLTPSAPVTLDLHNVTLRSFLRLMLHDLDLTYVIKDEVIQITSTEAAENNLVLKMHILPKIVAEKSDVVLHALQSTVQSDTWDVAGGPSTAVAIDSVLAVSTTGDVHDQIDDFLTKLELALEKSKAMNK